MNPERWLRLEGIFLAARELPAGEREAFLDRECAGDAALRADIVSLLGAADADPEFLDGTAVAQAVQPPPPRSIGPFRVERRIGEGGMGEVYLATHEGEGFERSVAIKLIRKGLGHRRLPAPIPQRAPHPRAPRPSRDRPLPRRRRHR